MRVESGQILRNEGHAAGWWRVPVGRALLAAAIAIPVMCAWTPIRTVQAFSRKDREQAEIVFKKRGCEHCHGVDGVGTTRGPSLATVGKRLSKDQIEQQLKGGGKQMPAFGDVLPPDEMKELVDYLVHKKKLPKGAPTS